MKYSLSEITDIIKDRRTIYPEFFSDRKVHKEIIEKLLNNAIWAPSHGMTQPWRFTVFMNDSHHRLSDFLSNLYKEKSSENFNEMKFEKLKNRPLKSSAIIAISVEYDAKGKISELDETDGSSLCCTKYDAHCNGLWYWYILGYAWNNKIQ
jgi:nitroreductase